MRLLVVEDDPRLSDWLRRCLTEEGHIVDIAGSLAEARGALDGQDVVILDRMLPDGDGLELLRMMRSRKDRRPVLCLTARDRVEERVEGLRNGADDYLVKPFALDELVARVQALVRRSRQGDAEVCVDDLVVDLDALRVWRGEEEVLLTPQEFRLLRVFAENIGRVMTRSRLLELAWDVHHDPGTNVVDVYVGYLRSKIDGGRERSLIRTVRGMGYVFEAPR
jgi:two-component system copper resistance phosphate regulon response regulator CusR